MEGGATDGTPDSDAAELLLIDASGLYKSRDAGFPCQLQQEDVRIDVDGRHPQMTASGTIRQGMDSQLHWVASLTAAGTNRWTGGIWHKDGTGALLPHSTLDLIVHRTPFGIAQSATVTFSGGGVADRTRVYSYASRYFHPVEFELDTVQGTTAVTEIDTGAHPNRPATLPFETLSIEKVFRRAGFNVGSAGSGGIIPLAADGADALWSDMELHDAMQTYWSRFTNRFPWSTWVLVGALHEAGSDLGSMMFDDIGPNRRQGTALFNDSFIRTPPAPDASPDAWAARSRFWAACHGMGHAFNLVHSRQKSLGRIWLPVADDPAGASFMSHDLLYGDDEAFFAAFEFRFSDRELLSMRHGPDRFAPVGNADWHDHHGFEQAAVAPQSVFRLDLRTNRPKAIFEFLEPAVLELKLTNVGDQPVSIDDGRLEDTDAMTVIIKKDGRPARQWVPYARRCRKATPRVLQPGESMYRSLCPAVGRNGWDLAEAGMYDLQVALHLTAEDVVSNRLRLRIATPRGFDEERVAQDFFCDEVGRVLAFGGSRHFEAVNAVLEDVTERLGDHRVARHALVALATPLARTYKQLDIGEGPQRMTSAADAGGRFRLAAARPDAARRRFDAALMDNADQAAETLGHIGYKLQVDRFAQWLSRQGDDAGAAECQARLQETLASRGAAAQVLQGIARRRDRYRAALRLQND